MSAIQLGHLVSAPGQPELQAKIHAIPACPLKHPRCLITGTPRSGKTSLLYHYCYKLAMTGDHVMFVCKRNKVEQTPPLLPQGVARTDSAWARINMKYISDIQELKKLGACLHLLPNPPSAIVVDDLTDIIASTRIDDKRARDAETTKALAYLVDATEQMMRHQDMECQLIVSDIATDEGHRSLYLLQRWFPLVLNISGTPPQALTLQVAPGCEQQIPPALARVRVQYSLTQSYVHVESIML